MDAHFNKGENVIPLLPREIAQHILFSSTKIKEIVEMLFVKPELENVEMVEGSYSYVRRAYNNWSRKALCHFIRDHARFCHFYTWEECPKILSERWSEDVSRR